MNIAKPLLETYSDAVALFALLLIILAIFIGVALYFAIKAKNSYVKRHQHLKRIHKEKRID